MLKRNYSLEKKTAFIAIIIFLILAILHFSIRPFFELSIWICAVSIIITLYYRNKREKRDFEHARNEWEQIINEQQNLILKLESMMDNAEKLSIIGELAAGIAHEVRNPLTTLKGFLQLMNSSTDITTKSYLDLMLAEVNRIEMITDEFMSVAKPREQHFKEENIVSLIEQVTSFLHPQAQLNNVQVLLRTNGEISPIICEGNQLKQVFINIMKNAFEAMPKGGFLFIMITQEISKMLNIKFIDQGVGIPAEVLEKLGQPFFTQKEGGHGLGIMMCQRIINSHHGKMEIKSRQGDGTMIEIFLPVSSHPLKEDR